jgi:hypothetical protein
MITVYILLAAPIHAFAGPGILSNHFVWAVYFSFHIFSLYFFNGMEKRIPFYLFGLLGSGVQPSKCHEVVSSLS